jgi:plastocyanin
MSAAPDLVPPKTLAAGPTTTAVVAKSATGTTVTAAAASTGVTIKDFKFAPASTSVHVGDTITWTNQDVAAHTATATGSFDTGSINQGKSGSHTFTKAGTFAYICSIHPSMKGTVIVAAASGSSSGSGSGGSGSSGSGGTTATPSSSSSLPQTGLDLAVVVLLAALMMAAGTALRRTAE